MSLGWKGPDTTGTGGPPPRGLRRAAHGRALMTALLSVLGVAVLLPAGAPVRAQIQAETFVLGDLRIPPPTGYVNDFADAFTRAQRSELEQICRAIDRQTGAQIAVALVPGMQGEVPADVKTRLYETWGVGRKGEDRGLLILHALEERRIEVEVGYGLEPILNDARVGRILDQYMVPALRDDRFFEAYRAGLRAFGEVIATDPDARPGSDAYRTRSGSGGRTRAPRSGDGGFPWGALLLAPVFLYLLIRHPRLLFFMMLMGMGGGRRGGGIGGGGFGGGFGGFGGGMSGGGGAGRSY